VGLVAPQPAAPLAGLRADGVGGTVRVALGTLTLP